MDEILTTAETADLLRISRSTLDRLRGRGCIHPTKIGGQVMYRSSEIRRYLDTETR